MLTALVLLPVAAAIVVILIPARRREVHLPLGIALSVMPLALAGYLFSVFEPAAGVPVRRQRHLVRAVGHRLVSRGGRDFAPDGRSHRSAGPTSALAASTTITSRTRSS